MKPTTQRATVPLQMPQLALEGRVSKPRNRHLRARVLQQEARFKRLIRVAKLFHSLADLVTRVFNRWLLTLIYQVLVHRKKRLKRSMIQSIYLLRWPRFVKDKKTTLTSLFY